MNTKFFRKLTYCKIFTIQIINSIRAQIILLFFFCSPTTISRFITSVIINSIKRHIFWFFSHIFKKILKAINPICANRNSATSVISKKLTSRICTSLLHACPGAISFASGKPRFGISQMKTGRPGGRPFFMKTSTGMCFSIYQMIATNGFNFSAIAFANPTSSFFGRIPFQHQESRKSFVSKIEKIRHKKKSFFWLKNCLYNVDYTESQAYGL